MSDAGERCAEWERALERGTLPAHVAARLEAARAGRTPWVATMTPAELRLARSHGVRPIAAVSGTCWFHYGWSWTEGHAEGWHRALDRLRTEAVAAGANAVVDVRLRTLEHRIGASMDFTLIGTAIRVERLRPSPEPVVATVPALEFVRLLEADIVPVGIAVGAQYDWFTNYSGNVDRSSLYGSYPLRGLTNHWEVALRSAHAELRRNAARQGNGVLAHTHFGQILRQERDKQPPRFLARAIVIGTAVDARPGARVPAGIEPVVDMAGRGELAGAGGHRHAGYDLGDNEGAI